MDKNYSYRGYRSEVSGYTCLIIEEKSGKVVATLELAREDELSESAFRQTIDAFFTGGVFQEEEDFES